MLAGKASSTASTIGHGDFSVSPTVAIKATATTEINRSQRQPETGDSRTLYRWIMPVLVLPS